MSWTGAQGWRWKSKKEFIQIKLLDSCVCPNPDDILIYVRDMLEKIDKQDWGSHDDMPYMFFACWANSRNFANHAATVRCSWLTEKGINLLNDLNQCLQEDA